MPKSGWPRSPRPRSAPAVLMLLACLASPLSLLAQGETTSAIVGSVSDLTGAAIAGASVSLTSTDNGLKRSVKTDVAGRFNFPQLKPGSYSVKVEAAQFEAQENVLVRRHRRSAAHQSAESEYLDDVNRAIARRPSESGRRYDVSAAVCRWSAHQHRRQRE